MPLSRWEEQYADGAVPGMTVEPELPDQIFCIVSNEVMKKIAQDVEFGFWEKYDETHSVIRFATSWATTMEDTQKLIQILEKNK